jgi:hypothetical protein
MKNLIIEKVVRIKPYLTADDWSLKDVEEFGARDTAVLEILERVLDEIYGA